MSNTIKVKKGLKINLPGLPEKIYAQAPMPSVVAIKPTDILYTTPKLAVKAGEQVKAGDILFFDKDRPSVKFPSPVSGEVAEIIRGEKRRVLEVRVIADAETNYVDFGKQDPANLDGAAIREQLQNAGLWSFITQRPYGTVADPESTPRDIFISGFDTNPLAPDMEFIMHGEEKNMMTALTALSKLTTGNVHVSISSEMGSGSAFANAESVKNVKLHTVKGQHPAGNVGVQIHAIKPVNKGEVVWTVGAQELLYIGRFFNEGKFDASKIVAVGGSGVSTPKHYKTILGAPVADLLADNVKSDRDYRVVSGSPLSGNNIGNEGFVGFYDNQVCVLPEGNDLKFFLTEGWLSPGFNRFSMSRAYPTWLLGKNKKYDIDTNLNGEIRSFVMSGQYDKVFPFNIYPVQLIKAIMAGDIELMENLGIYEVVPEDFALCDFVCTSKIDAQVIVRDGLEALKKELS